ncbi:hypothetical protein D3C76_1208980 [compost metagenome]
MHQVVGGEEVGLAPGQLLLADPEGSALAHRKIDIELTDLGPVVEVHDVAAAIGLAVVVGAHFLQVLEEVGLDLAHAAQLGHHGNSVGSLPFQVEAGSAARHGQLASVVVTRGVLPVLGVPGHFLAQVAVNLDTVIGQQRHGESAQGDRQGELVERRARARGRNTGFVHVVSPGGVAALNLWLLLLSRLKPAETREVKHWRPAPRGARRR